MGPLDVEGIWWTRRGNAQVEITRTAEGSIRGDIIWTDTAGALAEDGMVGASALDPVDRLGKTLFENYDTRNNGWVNGSIYDLVNDRAYRSNIRLIDEDTLAVEGCRGIFCRTQRWKRVENDEVMRLKLVDQEVPEAGN